MEYKYRRPKANSNANKPSHWVNASFADGDGVEQQLKNKFIGLKTADADVYLIDQYEEARRKWDAATLAQSLLTPAELKKIPEDKRVPTRFRFKIPAYIEVVSGQSEKEAPGGELTNVA